MTMMSQSRAETTETIERRLSDARRLQAETIARGVRRAYRRIATVFSVPGGTPELRR